MILLNYWAVADQIRNNNKDILLDPQQRQSFGVYSFAIQLMQRRSDTKQLVTAAKIKVHS